MILDKNFSNQSLLFLISIALERMGFYGIRVLLVIYMISPTFGMTNKETMTIYSWFVSLIIIAKIIGALIGDFVIGNKNSIVVGGILQAVGAFLVSVPSIYTFYSGLFLIILGGGLYSPNLIANFGKLHLYQSKLLDAQFTLLYLFINIGKYWFIYRYSCCRISSRKI